MKNFFNEFNINEDYKDFFTDERINKILTFLNNQTDYTPKKENIFRALEHPIKKQKICILGQDPYPQEGIATGLSFQVNSDSWNDKNINASLKNILKLIYLSYTNENKSIDKIREDIEKQDFLILNPKDLFDYYHNNGVLLINSYLTTKIDEPLSHKSFWQDIVLDLLEYINSKNPNIIHFIWGNNSLNLVEKLNNKLKNIFFCSHPSFSGKDKELDFSNSTCFKDTKELINWLGNKDYERYNELVKDIKYHNDLYYNQNTSEISDKEYDNMYKELSDLSEKLNVSSSILISVGGDADNKFTKVKHSQKMLSLSNTYSINDLKDFDRRVKKILANDKDINYFIELKIDGLSISLIYEKGILTRAITRGDGAFGEDVTENIKNISSIPHKLKEDIDIEVRGEVIIFFDEFNKLNLKRKEEGLEEFANPRNTVAGTIRQKKASIVKERNLDCFLYYIINPEKYNLKTQEEAFTYLEKLGFKTTKIKYLESDFEKIQEIIDKWNNERENLEYATDGLVLKVNDFNLHKTLSETAKSPRWAIAYKFETEKCITKVKSVTLQIGKTGVITPVAELEPVNISGSTVSRASLHNFLNIQKKDIQINDYVLVEKAAEIIPYIIEVVKEKRDGTQIPIKIPTLCPYCGSLLEIDPEKLTPKCNNDDCYEKKVARFTFFVSKQGMKIDSLGENNIRFLISNNYINTFSDLYYLENKKELIVGMPGFKETLVNNILIGIKMSKLNDFNNLLSSLSIQNVSSSMVNTLISNFPTIDKLKEATFDELIAIKGIGNKNAKSIIEFFQSEKIINEIEEFKKIGLILENKASLDKKIVNKISKALKTYKKQNLSLFEKPSFNRSIKDFRIENTKILNEDEYKEFLEFIGLEYKIDSKNIINDTNELDFLYDII